MKAAILSIFFFAAVWALPKGQNDLKFKRIYVDPLLDKLPADINSRITNGKEAIPHSIPYQAYLIVTSSSGAWLCGGSLISPKHVLTAAHCLVDGIKASVYLGAHNVREVEATRILVESSNLIHHADYNPDEISDDIGVIILNEPVELNENVNTVPLPSRPVTTTYEGENARVSGWGLVTGDGDTSPVLLEVNSTIISNAQCARVYSIVIDSQLCISGVGGVGSCNGDSGGPLVADNVQVGIVSYGAKGCLSGYPSAFTRVTSYLDWLAQHTGLDI